MEYRQCLVLRCGGEVSVRGEIRRKIKRKMVPGVPTIMCGAFQGRGLLCSLAQWPNLSSALYISSQCLGLSGANPGLIHCVMIVRPYLNMYMRPSRPHDFHLTSKTNQDIQSKHQVTESRTTRRKVLKWSRLAWSRSCRFCKRRSLAGTASRRDKRSHV